MDVEKIREDFPILKKIIAGVPLAYLDNAATSQKPIQVINAVQDHYSQHNANVHRAIHTLSEESTRAYEEARKKTAKFVNAASPAEIVFTRNATEAINLVRYAYALNNVKQGEKIVSTIMEHHSNFVPWQQLRSHGAEVVFVDVTDQGFLKIEEIAQELEAANVKLVAVTHASNTLGTINDVKKVCKMAREAGAVCLVDAAQTVPHQPVDVREIGCDFLVFSGHKMLAPNGIGALYARKEILAGMPPFLYGGEMIKQVTVENTEWNDYPWKYEAGTPNVEGAVGLGAAMDYINAIGLSEIHEHEKQLTKYALEKLSAIDKLEIYGPREAEKRAGLVSFNVADIHPHDLAAILDGEGIAIRSGHNCTQPLISRLGIKLGAVARASFYLYNTLDEVDRLVAAIEKAKKLFRV